MEEKIIMQSKANYFQSATKMLEGYLTLTDKRITYSGTQDRIQLNHGLIGNAIRDKVEKAMGYDEQKEEFIFDLPADQVTPSLKRFGFGKKLILACADGKEFKLLIHSKKERDEWPQKIEDAKRS